MTKKKFSLAILGGKKHALDSFEKRKKKNAKEEKIDNRLLAWLDLPLHFYCRACGDLTGKLRKDQLLSKIFFIKPKELCNKCQALKDREWLKQNKPS